MKKKTFAIYTVLMLVFVIAAGFIGYDLGKAKGSIFAKNTNAKNLTKITSNGASSKKMTRIVRQQMLHLLPS